MDIVVQTLSKEFLNINVEKFVEICLCEEKEYWSAENFCKDLPEKYTLSVYALFNGKVAGFIIGSKKENVAHVHKFMVHPEFRSLSIGGKMQLEFEKRAASLKLEKEVLSVYKWNIKGIEFYQRLNFYIDGEKIDSVNKGEMHIMKKDIL